MVCCLSLSVCGAYSVEGVTSNLIIFLTRQGYPTDCGDPSLFIRALGNEEGFLQFFAPGRSLLGTPGPPLRMVSKLS